MTNIRNILACNMKKFRREQGLSQSQLAEKVGTAPNYISNMEAEKQFPSSQMIEKLASALGVDSVELFGTEEYQREELRQLRDELVGEIRKVMDRAIQRIKG